jgi:tetratricopeptide (TPR) repeat protein
MPSHIFTRVGAWEDSADTNRRSEAAARKGGGGVDEALHAIDYQVYAYLQLARDSDARRALERALADGPRASNRPAGPYALAAAPARYALERGDWAAAAQLPVRESPVLQATAITHFARAIGAARSGSPQAAADDLAQLAALRDRLAERKVRYWAEQVEILRLGSAGWVAFAEGRRDEGLALMRQAADLESRTEKSPISPGPVRPARELLGDMLLDAGQPAAALKEYEASQQREPNRFRGYYGAAVAAAKAGDQAKARANFDRLAKLAAKGEPRPELKQLRGMIASL